MTGQSATSTASSCQLATRRSFLAGSAVDLDPKGFVLTGADAAADHKPLETSRRGVFAIGDVRSGSVKRVAAAVGEGAQVVATLHGVLGAATRPLGVVSALQRRC